MLGAGEFFQAEHDGLESFHIRNRIQCWGLQFGQESSNGFGGSRLVTV